MFGDRSSDGLHSFLAWTYFSLADLPCFSQIDDTIEIILVERFSKPNFGSIRRFRTMTGLEIEN